MYREIIAVCSEIHTKHINTLCGQNVEFLNVEMVVHIVTTELQRITKLTFYTPYMALPSFIYDKSRILHKGMIFPLFVGTLSLGGRVLVLYPPLPASQYCSV
jgi:hypothetical protein